MVATITATAVNKNYFETIVDIPEAGDYTLQFFQTSSKSPTDGAWSSAIDDVSISRVPGITVDAGGTIDMNGQTEYQDYSFVMNGGTFDNTGTRATYSGKSMVSRMLLTADSVFAPTNSYGFSCYLDGTYYETFLNLGGHELKAKLTDDHMYMLNCTMTNGTFSVTTNCVDAQGTITFIGAASSACDVDLNFDCIYNLYVNINGIRNLSLGENACNDVATGRISLGGTFSTLSTKFGNTALGDGATLDLSGNTGALSVTSTSGKGQTISFPDGGAITVDAGSRALSDGMQLLSWAETEVMDITTVFTLDYDGKPAEDPEFFASVRTDGLYVVYSGTPVYARISLGGEEPAWVFYDANDNQVTTWEGGVTSDMAVRFSSYAEYTAIAERASGISPTEYVLDGNFALPDETGTADMTGLSFRCEEGVTIDVKGQTLAFPYTMFSRAEGITITSSLEGGVLTVEVPESVTVNNSAVSLTGSLRFCLVGNPNSGRFYAAKADQTYTGGTEISSGVLYGAASGCLGPAGSEVIVDTDGRMDLNGQLTIYKDYDFVLNGGTLQNTISDIASDVLDVTSVQLAADSSFAAAKNWGLVGENYEDVSLDLGGHTLEVRVYSGQWFFIYADEIKNGTINANAHGWLRIAESGRAFTDPINATNVDFVVDAALDINRPVDVRNYEAVYNANNNRGSYQFNVHGKFKPSAHDYFRGCEMQDGSTLDLSARTNACPVVSSFSNGEKTLTFAENANVTVNLDGRTDLKALVKSEDARIVSWDSETAPDSSVKFLLGGEAHTNFSLRVGDDGLYLVPGGFFLLVR